MIFLSVKGVTISRAGICILFAGLLLYLFAPSIPLRLQAIQTQLVLAEAYGYGDFFVGDYIMLYAHLLHSGGYVWGFTADLYLNGQLLEHVGFLTCNTIYYKYVFTQPGRHVFKLATTEYGVTPTGSGGDITWYREPVIWSDELVVDVQPKPADPDVITISVYVPPAWGRKVSENQYSFDGAPVFEAGIDDRTTRYSSTMVCYMYLQRWNEAAQSWVTVAEDDYRMNYWSARLTDLTVPKLRATYKYRIVAEGHGGYGETAPFYATAFDAPEQVKTATVKTESTAPVVLSDSAGSTLAEPGENVPVASGTVTVNPVSPSQTATPSQITVQPGESKTVAMQIVEAMQTAYAQALRNLGLLLILAGAVLALMRR
jgi:hypothetical protein